MYLAEPAEIYNLHQAEVNLDCREERRRWKEGVTFRKFPESVNTKKLQY